MSETVEIPVKIGGAEPDVEFKKEVEKLSGQKIPDCYQCGECTAGCPVCFAMDLTPNQVMRMVQMGLADEVLKSEAIWLCAGCETCATRCPKLVELSKVMDALRQIAVKRGIKCPDPEIQAFHETFLYTVENLGRVHEMGMIGILKAKTKKFFKDVPTGIKLFMKGKLALAPSIIKDRQSVKRIFREARKGGKKP